MMLLFSGSRAAGFLWTSTTPRHELLSDLSSCIHATSTVNNQFTFHDLELKSVYASLYLCPVSSRLLRPTIWRRVWCRYCRFMWHSLQVTSLCSWQGRSVRLRMNTARQTSWSVLCFSLMLHCTFIPFLKAALAFCRKRLRRAVSFCRKGVGGLVQRSLSL